MRKSYRTLAYVVLAIFVLFYAPLPFANHLRGKVAGAVGWAGSFFRSPTVNPYKEELLELQIENWALQNQLNQLQTYLLAKGELDQKETAHIKAQLLYRSPLEWNSTLWVDVGEKDNERLGKEVIAKNSPVIFGHHLVGIVETVQKNKAKVRLLTDHQLVPAVRAVREGEKERLFLAKGELHGSMKSHFRRSGTLLIGEGFNYDYEDDEGPARDLRTGAPLKGPHNKKVTLIQTGDLLVTTGMDGLFPPGLHVATVQHVAPLKEGDYTYEIRALPTAPHLENLQIVFILPPVES